MMAAKELKEAWHVPIYACEKEIEVLSDSRKSLVSSYYREPYTLTPDITVKEGDELSIAGFTWKVFETPGHTIGSCCYYIEKESVLFSGDTLFAGSYGRTDFPTGSGRQIAESVRRLLSTLPDDTMVYPGHMDTTTIGFEKKYNPLSGEMCIRDRSETAFLRTVCTPYAADLECLERGRQVCRVIGIISG